MVTEDEIEADGQRIPQLDVLQAENDIVIPRDIKATIRVGPGRKEDIVPDLFDIEGEQHSLYSWQNS